MQGAQITSLLAIALAALAFGVGCGSDEGSPEAAGVAADATVEADRDEDRELALDLQDYLVRNCLPPEEKSRIYKMLEERDVAPVYRRLYVGGLELCGSIATIEVSDTRVTIRSGIDGGDPHARPAGEAFCNLIRGSDVADFTNGHELQDSEGEAIRVCSVREN